MSNNSDTTNRFSGQYNGWTQFDVGVQARACARELVLLMNGSRLNRPFSLLVTKCCAVTTNGKAPPKLSGEGIKRK